ncbi:MAG TPA: helix-turn-helix domain-containing protein [Kofleriaceae bacterium]|nr:helix-turn-helix domain-containing protein [Kofleriaceae bacterium]
MTPLRARLRDALGDTVGRGHARARILAAAIDTFAEHGVAAVRVEDIIVAAEVSRRTFYQHFAHKLAVVHALFELVTQHLAQTFAAAVARTTDPRAAIDEALDVYLELHRTDRDIVRALLEESLRADSPLYPLRVRFRRDIMRGLDAMFAVATRRALDPMVGLALVSAVEGISRELLAGTPSRRELARAKAVIAGLIALIAAHGKELP